jgi:hypothetical protein
MTGVLEIFSFLLHFIHTFLVVDGYWYWRDIGCDIRSSHDIGIDIGIAQHGTHSTAQHSTTAFKTNRINIWKQTL